MTDQPSSAKHRASSRDQQWSFLEPIPLIGLFGKSSKRAKQSRELGAPPGIDHLKSASEPPKADEVVIRTIDFREDQHEERRYDSIDHLFAEERPAWSKTRWIDIQGIHPYVLRGLQERYGIHPLAAEDTLHAPQRPKVEEYENELFIILRMLRVENEALVNEQVVFFYFEDTVITIQEHQGDVWEKVRQRIRKPVSRFRKYGTPYLLYALIDAIVDHIFPFLDLYFESIDKLESEILENPTNAAQSRIHAIKRELVFIRQALWPMQSVIASLAKDDYDVLPDEVENYFRDVHDHANQATEALEMYRETANGLQDLHMAASSNRLNEVMKALTIMASLFLPLTFIAGVYGMNFEVIPELKWPYSYLAFWIVCFLTISGLLYYFRRKKWIGN